MPTACPARLGDLSPAQARLCLDVESFVREMVPEISGATILAGVSGGPDSTALLLILRCLASRVGMTLAAAHLDHGLRPESEDEAVWVQDLCRRLDIPCHTQRARLPPPGSPGLEAAARKARYAFFETTRLKTGAGFLAVGHTQNDLAEDIVLRLIRGCGWPALGGMPAFDPARSLVRPLLLTPRARLLEFLAGLGVRPAEDKSNADPACRRNRVRHRILPLLVAENPGFLDAAARLWRQAAIDRDYFRSDPVLERGPRPAPEGGVLIPERTWPTCIRPGASGCSRRCWTGWVPGNP